jgi:uncharacterized protein YcfJ
MRVLRFAVIVSSVVGMAACNRPVQQQDAAAPDLSWLDTMDLKSPVQKVDSAAQLAAAEQALLSTAQPTAQTASAPVRHTAARTSSTRHRSTASRSSSGTYSQPVYSAPRTTTVKHTRRDAAIGGATGAVIGAVAGGSRHRVKGAIIGGVAGAVAGAVIGNNVDKTTRVQW